MTFQRRMLTLAVAAALMPFAAQAAIVPVMEDLDIVLVNRSGEVVDHTELIAQTDDARKRVDEARSRADEARARADEARKRADRAREDIHISLPDVSTLVHDAVGSAFAYSFSGTVKSIRNAPYSGEVVNEKIQTLADGNQLVKRSSNRVWRDSSGATRQEIFDADGKLKTIYIRDGEGSRFVLNPAKKSAVKISSPKVMVEKHSADSKDVKDIKDNKKVVINTNQNIVVKRVEGSDKSKTEEVRVIVNGDGMDLSALSALGDLGQLGDMFSSTGDAFAQAWRHGEPTWVSKDKNYEKTSTKLGTRNFEGVPAEGKGSSYTIPAGKIGNQKPIVVSTESWYSPDLQITVYSKHSDPRSGDTIYRVANLKRAEPSPDLFRVPADYEVRDPLARLRGKITIDKSSKPEKMER